MATVHGGSVDAPTRRRAKRPIRSPPTGGAVVPMTGSIKNIMQPSMDLLMYTLLALLAVGCIAGCIRVLGTYASNQRARQELFAEAKRRREAYGREIDEKYGRRTATSQALDDDPAQPATAGNITPRQSKKAA